MCAAQLQASPRKRRDWPASSTQTAWMLCGVARNGDGADALCQFLVAVDELQLAGAAQGFPVVGEVGAAGAFVGEGGIGHFEALDEIAGVGEGGDGFAIGVGWIAPVGAAAGVVGVEVGHEDDVDVFRSEADAVQVGGETPVVVGHAEDAPLLGGDFVALAGVDQDQAGGRWDEEGAHLHGDAVFVVGADDAFPEDAGHEAEEAAAVDQLAAVADDVAGDGADLE